MTKKKTDDSVELRITPLDRQETTLRIIGTTPLFQNRMSNKVQQMLLVGGRKKSAAERLSVKHDVVAEFLSSAEIMPDGPTALGLRSIAIKAAMVTAATQSEGIFKNAAEKLLFVPGDLVPLYGIPQLRCDVVRSKDIARTPDVRTRCYLPRWGAELTVGFVAPQLNLRGVYTLAANAGIIVGVGDYRQEKGKGSFGSFRVVPDGADDDEWNDLVKTAGRKQQQAALDAPQCANKETSDLVAYWADTVSQRRAA